MKKSPLLRNKKGVFTDEENAAVVAVLRYVWNSGQLTETTARAIRRAHYKLCKEDFK